MKHRAPEVPGPTSGGVPQTNGAMKGILPDSLSESDPQSIPFNPPVDGFGNPITVN